MKIKSPIVLLSVSVLCVMVLLLSLLFGVIFLIENNRVSDEKKLKTFSSCKEIDEYIGQTTIKELYNIFPQDSTTSEGSESADSELYDSGVDFSETNIQVEGVDEADVVKTNGESLFIFESDSNTLNFIDVTDPAKPEVINTIDYYGTYENSLYLYKNKLIVTSYTYDFRMSGAVNDSSEATLVDIYDITDLTDVSSKETVALPGRIINSRFVDGNIYLVSESYVSGLKFTENSLPRYQINKEQSEPTAKCDQISVIGNNTFSLTNLSAFNVENIEKSINFETLLGNSNQLYMSKDNLFLTTTIYDYGDIIYNEDSTIAPREPQFEDDKTEIVRLSLKNAQIEFEAKGSVPGALLNQFSMDEYYGTFRVATTTNSFGGWNSNSTNNLYVLDKDLNIEGRIENLAEGEQIYAARFLGDKAYMVTFRQVDPLFAIDLSDPKNPVVKGELKIPGFSNYLQPISENTILGIGQEATESGRITGIKVSLFDVSDITDPKVIDDYVYEDASATSEANSNHKAVLFDLSKNLLSIPISGYDYIEDADSLNGFLVFDITENSIEERGEVDFQEARYYYYSNNSRSFYIGDYLYFVKSGNLKITNFDDLKEVSKLDLSAYDYSDKPIPYYDDLPTIDSDF